MARVNVSLVAPSYQTAQRESTCQAGRGAGFRTSGGNPRQPARNAARARFAHWLAMRIHPLAAVCLFDMANPVPLRERITAVSNRSNGQALWVLMSQPTL
ncbi:MAG: hypothetical protein CMJ75_12550 [Planctomycetaceae bacterium]|nr:hypothetical protein [Planctomycetaceae bacterium]